MTVNNYVKPAGDLKGTKLYFPFDDRDEVAMASAFSAARAAAPSGRVAVFRVRSDMMGDDTIYCVGHAPVGRFHGFQRIGIDCDHCGQFYPGAT